jgi:hypothetical protein
MKNSYSSKRAVTILAAAAVLASILSMAGCSSGQTTPAKLKFAISFSAEKSKTPLDGRMLLLISKSGEGEPRN